MHLDTLPSQAALHIRHAFAVMKTVHETVLL
jgi:hypothetical protein